MPTDQRRRVLCPACGQPAEKSRVLFHMAPPAAACAVQECRCGLVYKNWIPAPGAIRSMYSESYVHFQDPNICLGPADINSARQKLSRCRRLLPKTPPPGGWKLLDVGCGAGYFVSMARDQGYAAEGLDAFLPAGLEKKYLRRGSLEDLEPESYDIMSLLNVAEHLVDPTPLFSSVFRALRPHGVLLLTCPYGASLARRVHRDRWIHMALDEHLLFWTPSSLTSFLRPLGFKGRVDYRIAGSPFPFGKVGPAAPSETRAQGSSVESPSWQQGLWKLARWIQAQEETANVVRTLVHGTGTGDYLEYVIQKNRAG